MGLSRRARRSSEGSTSDGKGGEHHGERLLRERRRHELVRGGMSTGSSGAGARAPAPRAPRRPPAAAAAAPRARRRLATTAPRAPRAWACVPGTQTCGTAGMWGTCTGEVTPPKPGRLHHGRRRRLRRLRLQQDHLGRALRRRRLAERAGHGLGRGGRRLPGRAARRLAISSDRPRSIARPTRHPYVAGSSRTGNAPPDVALNVPSQAVPAAVGGHPRHGRRRCVAGRFNRRPRHRRDCEARVSIFLVKLDKDGGSRGRTPTARPRGTDDARHRRRHRGQHRRRRRFHRQARLRLRRHERGHLRSGGTSPTGPTGNCLLQRARDDAVLPDERGGHRRLGQRGGGRHGRRRRDGHPGRPLRRRGQPRLDAAARPPWAPATRAGAWPSTAPAASTWSARSRGTLVFNSDPSKNLTSVGSTTWR